jgi:hypothetical protein
MNNNKIPCFVSQPSIGLFDWLLSVAAPSAGSSATKLYGKSPILQQKNNINKK